ncbi:MAG: class I SAM-dependent methyltransferase [Alphaproteobacteria bacterium]|nr:class I SAM-dependent methyltransferase [Alphaproteobacteria bacterium]
MSNFTPLTQTEYWNSKVGEEWARQADLMDRMLQPLTQPAFDLLNLKSGERVLDIGCGAGATTLKAATYIGDGIAVGADISKPLLELARKRANASGANAHFVEADVAATPLRDAPFDAAFSRFGVMFFDDTAAAFAKIRAAMNSDGRIVFICWRTFAENGWSHAPLAALQPILNSPITPADPSAPGPFQLQDPEKIKTMLATSGWRDVSITPWDGDVFVAGGGDAQAAAAFLLKIGPCARAITDQQLDPAQAEQMLADFLRKYETSEGVALPAACWIVRAVA